MSYTFYDEVYSLGGRTLADGKARERLDSVEKNVDWAISEIMDQKENTSLLYILANSANEYDATSKYTQVNSAISKMEHESSLMNLNGSLAVYFVLNTIDTTDCSASNHNAKGVIVQNGTVTDLTEETGVYFATGRVQHGDSDVIIATNESGEAYLVKYADAAWTASKFTNNSGVSLDGCNSQMMYQNGKFYHSVCKGTTTTFPLICFDIENMTIEKVANIALPCDFEGIYESSLFNYNGNIYLAIRPSYNSLSKRGNKGIALIGILESLDNPTITKYIYLPDGSSRILFFSYNNRLYCVTNDFDRINGHLFDITDFYNYEPVALIKNNINYPDFLQVGSNLYWSSTDKKNTSAGCKVVFGQFAYKNLLI